MNDVTLTRQSLLERTIDRYWALDAAIVLRSLQSSDTGLTSEQARQRLAHFGPNALRERTRISRIRTLWNQVRSPLLLLLVFAASMSAGTGQWTDAAIVIGIVLATVVVGYQREYSADLAVAASQSRVKTVARVIRDGTPLQLPVEELTVGDVVLLAAGSVVPADAVVIEATDCYVSEAALTGESFPVAKQPGICDATTPLSKRSNCVFMGTNVRSGTARCVIVASGGGTQFGSIAHRLRLRPPQTEFDRGIRRFGYMLTSAMLVIVLIVFVTHVLRGRPQIETLLFAIALAVGLSPELLPAVLTVNLSRGATLMARQGVVVRRLNAIENLGSMDILCTDKTGTLTTGVVDLEGAYDERGQHSQQVLRLGALNAALETGLPSPLDDAIVSAHTPDRSRVHKLAEIPFDFVRKRVSVIIEDASDRRIITKGAFHQVLDICASFDDGSVIDAAARAELEKLHSGWTEQGIRVLAIASRLVEAKSVYRREDETELRFCGFLTFLDEPKEGVSEALANLKALGVSVKLISGDCGAVGRHVATQVGLACQRILTGADVDNLQDEALWREAERTDLFVEVDPNQKERIILALKKLGHVVGFLGDGVNDAPAMHAADTSLSVDSAVDVARAAADFVLLKRDLGVICRGIEEGRKTFANTLKYILTTTSANLGNMVSMAAASLFLPFLPLLAGQILLNNFISDVPALGIAGDRVDAELVAQPRRWDLRFISRFMIEFGILSSLFDLLTFALLLGVFHTAPELFRSAWFVESLLSELLIALAVRTRRPLVRSRPGKLLLWSTAALIPVAFAIPYLPYVNLLGFVAIPLPILGVITAIACGYLLAAELTKQWFYRH